MKTTGTSIYTIAIESYLHRSGVGGIDPKAALIDMDGTLYDSMPNHTAAWFRMVSELGIKADRDEFYLYEGRTGASTINIIFNRAFNRDATEEEIKELYRRKTVYFTELPPVGPMPGARAMLDTLRENGIKRVLVTGSGQNTLLNRIESDFPAAFEPGMRITSRDVVHGKPNPEPFLRAMEKAGVSPFESIVIENAPLGVEAGHRSGAFTVGITTGPIPRRAMIDAGADLVFDSMPEFAESLPRLLETMKQSIISSK